MVFSMSECHMLKLIKQAVESGTPPDDAVPYSLECASREEYIEVLYYAKQILPDGRRKEEIKRKLEELYAGRTDEKL